ncbi:hypothetical protein SNEBB_001447 [Seison nebaliae]|nr:hypothetical protein SNEBB_001447 [Seison nebaliae]
MGKYIRCHYHELSEIDPCSTIICQSTERCVNIDIPCTSGNCVYSTPQCVQTFTRNYLCRIFCSSGTCRKYNNHLYYCEKPCTTPPCPPVYCQKPINMTDTNCCPKCFEDCRKVVCPIISCPGQVKVYASGRCCAECIAKCKNDNCPQKLVAVCGSDGLIYRNRCFLKNAQCDIPELKEAPFHNCKTSCDKSKCREQFCPNPIRPTAQNCCPRCLEDCRHKRFIVLKCSEDKELHYDPGRCHGICLPKNHKKYVCPKGGYRVCASNGKWYENDCFFQNAKIDEPSIKQMDYHFCPNNETKKSTIQNIPVLESETVKYKIKETPKPAETDSSFNIPIRAEKKMKNIVNQNRNAQGKKCDLDNCPEVHCIHPLPPNEQNCCPSCLEDCMKVVCQFLRCGPGEVSRIMGGKCCATCEKISCEMKNCKSIPSQPICASNMRIYKDHCEFNRMKCLIPHLEDRPLSYCHIKMTGCERKCSNAYDPVCGSDNNTYQNYCAFRNANCRRTVKLDIKLYSVCP